MNAVLGKKILVTRPDLHYPELTRQLKMEGMKVFDFPLLKVEGLRTYDLLDSALREIDQYHWLIFLNALSIDYFIAYLLGKGYDRSYLKNIKISSWGLETTQRLLELGLHSDFTAPRNTIEEFIEQFQKRTLNEEKVLIIGPKKYSECLLIPMLKKGIHTAIIPIYHISCLQISSDEIDKLYKFGSVDVVIINDLLTLKQFIRLKGIWPKFNCIIEKSKIAVVASVMVEAINKEGINVDIIPYQANTPSLVQSIVDYYDNQLEKNKCNKKTE